MKIFRTHFTSLIHRESFLQNIQYNYNEKILPHERNHCGVQDVKKKKIGINLAYTFTQIIIRLFKAAVHSFPLCHHLCSKSAIAVFPGIINFM